MDKKERPEKRPAHELLPVIIAWMDEKRGTAKAVEGRMVFEMAIERICQVLGHMEIPEQDLPVVVQKVEVLSKHTDSRMVQQSLVDLATYLKAEIKPADQQA